jgi:4-amino-4-deoxy-L-arabinose transferase-like glycosyltransferase
LRGRSLTLGLLALCTGALGEGLLFVDGGRAVGFTLLAVAIVLAVAAWGRTELPPLLSAAGDQPARRWATPLRLAGIAGAVLLTAGSLVAWFADPDATFGIQGGLWLASIALLICACVRWRIGRGEEERPGPPWTRLEVAAFAGLVGLALFTYLARLNQIPWRFHYDEAIAYQEAMRFYRGPHISVFTTTWYGTGLPSMWFAISAGFMHLVGTGLGGVRFSVALLGALTVVPLYGLARLLIGRLGAVLAAFGWATTPVVIHYSRVSILNSTSAFFWAACFFFLLRGLRSRAPLDFALSGLLAGVSMYTYYGTRLLPFVLLAFGAYLVLFHRRAFQERASQLALVPVGFLVGFGPLLAYFVRNPDVWSRRGLSMVVAPDELPSVLRRNLLGLSVIRSNDHVYWAPFLQPTQAVLALLGAAVLVWCWRQPGAFLVVLWATSVLVVGGTLVDAGHVPAFNHWAPAFPAFFVAIALPVVLLFHSLRHAGEKWRRLGLAAVGAGAVAIAGVNAYTYLVTYPRSVPPSFEAAQGRFLAGLPSHAEVRFVGNSWVPYLAAVGRMMAPHADAGDLVNPSRSLPLVHDRNDLVFVFNDDETQYVPLVESYYPGGEHGRLQTPGGPVAYTYRVSAEQALAGHGARLRLAEESGRVFWAGRTGWIGALPHDVVPRLPATATWSGLFFTRKKQARLAVVGGAHVRLWVQGSRVSPGTSVKLDEGWVAFTLRARLKHMAPLRLLLDGRELNRGHLWPARPDAGLAVTLRGAATTFHRIDQFVGASVLRSDGRLLPRRDPDFIPVAPRRGRVELVRWQGQVHSDGGAYRLEMRTDARARLYVGGDLVLDLCDNVPPARSIYLPGGYLFVPGGYPVSGTTVTLARGWHSVRLDLQPTGANSGLEWSWTRPDGVREIVPAEALRHTAAQVRSQAGPAHIECGRT